MCTLVINILTDDILYNCINSIIRIILLKCEFHFNFCFSKINIFYKSLISTVESKNAIDSDIARHRNAVESSFCLSMNLYFFLFLLCFSFLLAIDWLIERKKLNASAI